MAICLRCELRLRRLLCRPQKLGELNPIPTSQQRASKGTGKYMGRGAHRSQTDTKPFLSCALHFLFQLPHSSQRLPKHEQPKSRFPRVCPLQISPCVFISLTSFSCQAAGMLARPRSSPAVTVQRSSLCPLILCPRDPSWLQGWSGSALWSTVQ